MTKMMIYQRVRKIWRKVKINKRFFLITFFLNRSSIENPYCNVSHYFTEEEDDDAEGEVEGEVEDEEDDA